MERLPKIPIVYHDKYTEDSAQSFSAPRDIYQNLLAYGLKKEMFCDPTPVRKQDLEWVHEERYLESLNNPQLMNAQLMNAAMYATGGTILACMLASSTYKLSPKYNWAINLGGGFNLALPDKNVDRCIISDVAMAIHSVWNEWYNTPPQILIIDLSAKQNTSYVEIFQNRSYPSGKKIDQINVCVKLFKMYAFDNFDTKDDTLKNLITFNHPLDTKITGKKYLLCLNKYLNEALEKIKQNYHETGSFYPNLIIYVAGTDLLEDVDGKLLMPNIAEEDIIARDELVFKLAEQYKIPVAMVLGSCTSPKASALAFRSILNILKLKKVLQ
jgi:acetoin utilization deacetylase AcuC-like enzyme